MDYQQVNLDTLEPIGEPGPVPDAFLGLDDATLADLSWVGEPLHAIYAGTGFWPVVVSDPVPFDPATEILTGSVEQGAPDQVSRTVPAVRVKRALTAEEIAARHPPLVLSKLQFIGLAQMAGGMTDTMLSTAHADPAFGAFWIKFQMAENVTRDDPITAASLGALQMANYLPNGAAAVLKAWPTA